MLAVYGSDMSETTQQTALHAQHQGAPTPDSWTLLHSSVLQFHEGCVSYSWLIAIPQSTSAMKPLCRTVTLVISSFC